MIVALAAAGFKNGDISYNKARMAEVIRGLRGRADLVVFGETFLQGFDSLSWNYEEDRSVALSSDDPIILEIRQEAESNGIAVSFGYIEKAGEALYSTQLTVGADGQIVNAFRRVSPGWKEPVADGHYREGEAFAPFDFLGKKLAVGLCGDMWHDENARRMKALGADAVLWPVYTDYNHEEWNSVIKHEYAQRAALFGGTVLYVNSVCLDERPYDTARGGAVCFVDGQIAKETPAGEESVLLVDC